MKARLTLLLLLSAALLRPGEAAARVFLIPNGEHRGGELSEMMGGSPVALSSGADAVWVNPAGMAKESFNSFSLGRAGLENVESRVGGRQESSYHQLPWNFSLVYSTSGRTPRFAAGFFSLQPLNHRFETVIASREVTGQSALPEHMGSSQGLDVLFPDGIVREEKSVSLGRLEMWAPGIGMGLALNERLRIGVGVRVERLSFHERTDSIISYSASGEAGSDSALSGLSRSLVSLRGETERTIYKAGLQADLGWGISVGLTTRLPSRQRKGTGSYYHAGTDSLTVTQAGLVYYDSNEFTQVEQVNVPFQMKSPRELRLGVAFSISQLAIELDIAQKSKLDSYVVFGEQESSTLSTRAVRTEALITSLGKRIDYGVGMALPAGNNSSFLWGYSQDHSGVSRDDPLFRKMDLETISWGYYYSKAAVSALAGITYRHGENRSMRFPHLAEKSLFTGSADYTAITLQTGFTFLF